MSWDIYIQEFPAGAAKVSDIPDDFRGGPLGSRSELIAKIQDALPGADFSDPTWGDFEEDGFSIEFNMGPEEVCDSIMLHVRGGGHPVQTIARLLEHLNLRAIDCQTGAFFDVEMAKASFGSWTRYRDQIVGLQADDDGKRRS
jgi:hypothetical protein